MTLLKNVERKIFFFLLGLFLSIFLFFFYFFFTRSVFVAIYYTMTQNETNGTTVAITKIYGVLWSMNYERTNSKHR